MVQPARCTALDKCLTLIGALLLCLDAWCGGAPSFKTLDVAAGLSHNTVFDILQDSAGRIWFATKDGLNVYDGQRFSVLTPRNSGLRSAYINCLYQSEGDTIWVGTDAGLYACCPATGTVEYKAAHEIIRWIGSDAAGRIIFSADGEGVFAYSHGRTEELYHDQVADHCTVWTMLPTPQRTWVSLYYTDLAYCEAGSDTLCHFVDSEGRSPFRRAMVQALQMDDGGHLLVGTTQGLYSVDTLTHDTRVLIPWCMVRCLCRAAADEWWVGCEDGIYVLRLSTGTYTHITAPSNGGAMFSLTDNAVYDICRDRDGGIWVGTYFGGVSYHDSHCDRFSRYYPGHEYPDMGRYVREMHEAPDGRIWIGTEDRGLFVFNPTEGTVTPVSDPRLPSNIHGICIDGTTLWAGSFAGGVARIDTRTGRVERIYRADGRPGSLNSDYVFAACRTPQGEVYIGTTMGVMRYDRATDTWHDLGHFMEFVYNMLCDAHGTLWMATFSTGVYAYTPATGQWQHYVHSDADTTSLPSDKMVSICQDDNGCLWFFTQSYDFACLSDRTHGRFRRYNHGRTVYKMAPATDGTLWLSSNKGIEHYDPATGQSRTYTTDDGLTTTQCNYQSALRASDGTYYFGTLNGFVAFNPERWKPDTVGRATMLYINRTAPFDLSHDEASVVLHAAPLSYRSAQHNRVQYMLKGLDTRAHDAIGGDIVINNIPPGRYTLLVWGYDAAGAECANRYELEVVVHPPFYRSTWAYVLYALLLAAAVCGGYMYLRHRSNERHRFALLHLARQKDKELFDSKMSFFNNIVQQIRTALLHEDTRQMVGLVNQLLDDRDKLYEGYVLSPQKGEDGMSQADKDFVERLNKVVAAKMQNPDFGQELLAKEMGMSRANLYRRMRDLLDTTPNDYIRSERLKCAARLLRKGGHTVNEVCYMVGYSTPSYFSKSFQRQFSMLPSEFVRSAK